MNDILKQRLVGALILIALGVVFWPIIFVAPPEPRGAQSQIPPRPHVDTSPLPSPDRAGLRGSPRFPAEHDEEGADEQGPLSDGTRDVAGEPNASTDEDLAKDPATTSSEPALPVPRAPTRRAPTLRTEAPVIPELDAQGLPRAWVLQVASVSSPAAAARLREQLLALGHKAYIEQVRINDRPLQRVYLGPKFERARLQALQAEIDAQFGVKSIVKRYVP